MSETVEVIFLIISIILSGFYSGSEAALVSISVDRLKRLMEEKDSRAFEFLLNKPHAVMNTILLGNNVVNIFAASLATNISARYFDDQALAISVGITTALILIFGEITPKTFARTHAERLAIPILRILQVNYFLFYPVVRLITLLIRSVLGKNAQIRGHVVTKRDIEYLVNRAEEDQTIDSKQIDLLNSILEFPKIKVKDIMIPRSKIVSIAIDAEFEVIINVIKESGHSRYPVFDSELDEMLGFLHVKDLAFISRGQPFDISSYLKPPFFVYEHMKIQAVFDHMNRRKAHLALVKDETGLIVGIITLEDIMEEIFGDIVDEHDAIEDTVEGSQPAQINGSGIIVSGSISLRDLDNTYDVGIPLNDNYSTLTGFLLDTLGDNFPKSGQIVFWEGFSFELKKIENHLIEEVYITKVKDRESSSTENT